MQEAVWPLIEDRPVPGGGGPGAPGAGAAEAHRVVEDGEHVGKVLLDVAAGR